MAKANIRIAGNKDLPAIERLSDFVQTLHAETRPDVFRIPVDTEGRRAFLEIALSDDLWRLWVAVTVGRIVGYLMTKIVPKQSAVRHLHTEGHLHQICVDPGFRRKGIGLTLVQQALEDFQSRKADRMTVTHWNFNEASRPLFNAAGFATVVTTSEWVRP